METGVIRLELDQMLDRKDLEQKVISVERFVMLHLQWSRPSLEGLSGGEKKEGVYGGKERTAAIGRHG
jgi:hypothetical protein